MTRRSVPRISPNDLRDHADEARIARVWDRIEHDLVGFEAPPKRGSRLAYLAVAAAFAAFGGGLFVGKIAYQERRSGAALVVASPDRSTVDVLAAGSEGRTFTLPGGGTLTLQPGATVELERGSTSTLKLLQGEASIDTARAAGMVIVAGDAQLNTQAGSVLNLRRNQDDVDVSVRDGSVSITSPAGSKKLDRGQSDAVPIHAPTSALSQTDSPLLARGARGGARAHKPNEPHAADPPATPATALPEWRVAYNNNDIAGALDQLRKGPGGLDGAIDSANAYDLMTIVLIKGIDGKAQTRAYERVVKSFPNDTRAPFAARELVKIYTAAGRPDLAKVYNDLANSGLLAQDGLGLCTQMRAEQDAGHKDEARRKAHEYVEKYPDGPCNSTADSILQGERPGKDGDPAAAVDASAPEKALAATPDAGAP